MHVTYPPRILLGVWCSVLTFGIYLPFWFIARLRKPKIDTVTIDEYGNQRRTLRIAPPTLCSCRVSP